MQEYINTIIGKQVYPIDNSYSKCLSNPSKFSWLAGTNELIPKLVTIISEPYNLTHKFGNRELTHEFVTVLYEKEVYVVINQFKDMYNDYDHNGSDVPDYDIDDEEDDYYAQMAYTR